MDIFSNREIAAIIWIAIIVIYISCSKKMEGARKGVKNVLSAFFVWQIQAVFMLMFAYVAIEVYILSELGVWNTGSLKNTIIWTLSVASAALFQIESIKKDRSFFKHSVLDNLKLIAIIEFFVGIYSFPIWAEFILLPVITMIMLISAVAERNEEHKSVKKVMDWLLSSLGFFLIGFTLYMLFTEVDQFAKEQTVYDFSIPPILTFFYLPFIFSLMVYMTYEDVFVRTQFSIKHRGHRFLAKSLAVIVFNVRIDVLERWSTSLNLQTISSYKDVVSSFRKIFKLRAAEKNPRKIEIKDGWSPYEIKDALLSEGLKTGLYNEFYDEGDWFASSPSLDIGDGILPNNIAYYVDGDEHRAKKLKLIINVNTPEEHIQIHKKLQQAAEILYKKALGETLPDEIEKSLIEGKDIKYDHQYAKISVTKEMYLNTSRNGYHMKFAIEHAVA